MRENRVKKKLSERKPAVVISPGSSADLIDFLGPLGFDGVWIDMEHGPFTWEVLSDLSRACDLWGMSSLVRVTTNDNAIIGRTLDRGVSGIIVPHVGSKEEVTKVLEAAKFIPVGRRGMSADRRGYGVPNYVTKANDDTIVIVMVEDVDAIEQLPEMLTMDHVDAFYVSHADLAQSMGFLDAHHPKVTAMFDKAIEKIAASGRNPAAKVGANEIEKYMDMGVRFLMTSWDTWVKTGATQYLEKVGEKAI